MRRKAIALLVTALLAAPAYSAGNHAGGHGHEAGMMAIGKPGDPAAATRAVEITMRETPEGEMVFEPASLSIEEGETVRLVFVNEGELEHEFVMDVHEGIHEHKELMARFPEMEHDDPNAIRLAPGAEGEIIWTFSNAGDYAFGCLIPGHYEAGMRGEIDVAH